MTATKHPDQNPPADPPSITRDSVYGVGEKVTYEWPMGTKDDIKALYDEYKADMNNGENIQQVTYKNQTGRGSLVVRWGREGSQIQGEPETVAMIEEVIAVDIVKDICEHPYFEDLTETEIAQARRAAEDYWDEDEIDARAAKQALGGGALWTNWSAKKKTLYEHILHGVRSYFETGFVFRRQRYSVRTAETVLTFDGINKVETESPGFDTDMLSLLSSLPAGEWLYRPPSAEYLGNGRWKTTQEWQWALKWSVIYGGSWGE